MGQNFATLEECVEAKFEDVDTELLDCTNGSPKPIWNVTIAGTHVKPDVLSACREVGYERICEIRQSTYTKDIGKCTTIIFFG